MPSRLDANNSFSLYGLMNKARTPMGKRKLKVGPGSMSPAWGSMSPAWGGTGTCLQPWKGDSRRSKGI
jgi:hypothetical protein